MAHHQKGDLSAAERLYQAILVRQPDHFGALHLSGVLACQVGQKQRGAALIAKAIEVNATVAAAHLNLARAHAELGRSAEALASYDRALALEPGDAAAHINRGNILNGLGRVAEALASYEKAIALDGGLAEAHNNRANALGSLGRWPEALAEYDRALALKPDFAAALANRANTLVELGRLTEALASCDLALSIDATMPHAHVNRGNILQALSRPKEALASHDTAIALGCDSELAHTGRAAALLDLGDPNAALASVDRALRIRPDNADAHFGRGYALKELGRIREAKESYERAVRDRPGHADAHSNLALCQLLLGQWEEGFRSYEWRKRRKHPVANEVFCGAAWLGQADIAGKTVLLFAEQGLGDTLQFCRYVPLVERLGARVVLSAPSSLFHLLRSLGTTTRLIDKGEDPGPIDFYCPLLSLPLALGTSLDTVPGKVPYLAADRALVERWATRLGKEGFKVGICWQGMKAPVDVGRSFPMRLFERLSKIPAVRLISLQKGDGADQIRHLPEGMRVETYDIDTGPHAFQDTAAIVDTVDLVITSDTAVAHLAGALGRPVWVALKQVPDWRWMLRRPDSPWYPTLRLFRQSQPDEWQPVFEAIETALRKILRER